MRFLFVGSDQIDFFKIGGIENSIKELAFYLLKNGHHVTIFKIDKGKRGRIYLDNKFGELEIYYGNKFSIRHRILISKFDVINFIQTPFESIVFTFLFLIKKILTKTITYKFFFTYPPFKKYAFFQSIKYKYLIDECFAFSKRLANEIKLITINVTFLFPPVSIYYDGLWKKKEKNSKTKILYAGRLSKDKGLDIVIDVFKKLDKKKYYIGISGYFTNKEDKFFYRNLINTLNIDHLNITEMKNKYKKNLYLPLYNFDILFLPYQSLDSTLDIPLLVLEGLVSGCNVLTSDIGDLSLLEGNIYCVKNYNNPQEFISMIRKIVNEDLKKYNYDEFSIKTIGKRYLKFLMKK